MDQFKLNDGTICKMLFIYQNFILYTKENDQNIYASKYEVNDKNIALTEVSDEELETLITKYKELGRQYD